MSRSTVRRVFAGLALVLAAGCDGHDRFDERVSPQTQAFFDARIRQAFASNPERRLAFRTSPSFLADDPALAAIFRRLGYLPAGRRIVFTAAALRDSGRCSNFESCRAFPVAIDEFVDSYAFRRGPKIWHMTDEVRVRVHVRQRPLGALGAAIAEARIFRCPRERDLEAWAGESTVSDSVVWLTFASFPLERTIDDIAPRAAAATAKIVTVCPDTEISAGGTALIDIDEYGEEYE